MSKPKFSYGLEIEWGDVDRRLQLPSDLGNWEYSETDIINIRELKNVSCDPLGKEPHWGGEINTVPTFGIDEQVAKFAALKSFFETNGCPPTPSSASHLHIHVRVPGLKDDIQALRKLAKFVGDNQERIISTASRYYDHPGFKGNPGAVNYYKFDGGRRMPQWMVANLMKAKDFPDFIRLHAAGKDGISMGRPFRYGINMYSLKHINTIEFRMFRATIEPSEVKTCLEFVRMVMESALEGLDFFDFEDRLEEFRNEFGFGFPMMIFDDAQYKGWQATKYPKERGKKERVSYDLA